MVSIKVESQYYHVWKCKRLHGKNNKINRENDLKKRKTVQYNENKEHVLT